MKTDIDRRLSRSAFPGSLPALANGILNWDIHRHSEDFPETVLSRRFQDIRVSEVSGGGCSGRRGDTHFLRDGGEFVALVCQLEGRVVCRERVREVRCEPGDVFLWSSRNSLEFRVDEWARTLTLMIPASRIDSVRVRSLSEASAFLGPDSTLGRLASAFFASLAADLSRLTQEEGQNAMTMAMGIVSSILRHAGSQGPGRERGKTFSSICSYIDRQLNNDRLKPGQIAEEHGISLRYLHMLFSQHDQTVAGYIREQRLFKSRLDVERAPSDRTIKEIAYHWGFCDEAHFGRLFKKRFGKSPSAWRVQSKNAVEYSTQKKQPFHSNANADFTAKRTRIPQHREQTGHSEAGSCSTIASQCDFTERKTQIQRFVDTNLVGIVVWNAEGEVLAADDAFLRMRTLERKEFTTRRVGSTPDERRESTERILAAIGYHGRIQPVAKEYVSKDASRVSVMVNGAELEASGTECIALVVDSTERKEVERCLSESYEMLQDLASHRETSREEERKHIARELHDELGQYLTALRFRASALSMQLGNDRPELGEQIKSLISLVDETMQVVRSVITSLRPAALDTGIAAALEWLAAEFNRNGHTACRLHLRDDDMVMSEDRAIALFRLAQEALTNVARHAAAEHVIIKLDRTPVAFLLEVRDDGRGFDPLACRRKSFGLAGMEERVRMLGGQIEIISSPGSGTEIKVRLPIS